MGLLILGVLGGAVFGFLVCYFILRGRLTQQDNNAHIEVNNSDVSKLLDEVRRVSLAIRSNKWYERGDAEKFDGIGSSLIAEINAVIEAVFGYMNDTPAVITIFDKDLRVMWLNGLCEEQGFEVGKKVSEIAPGEATATVEKNASQTIRTGENIQFKLVMDSPAGELTEEYIMSAIKNSKGEIIGATCVNFDMTEILAKGKKINAYQDFEAHDIKDKLNEGLAQGILHFNYAPEAYDEDTAPAAAAYKRIGDSLADSVAVIKSYVDEINEVLSAVSVGNLTTIITRNYIGDFDSIKLSVNSIITRLNETMVDISLVADGVSSGSSQLTQSSVDLSDGVSQQMLAMQEISEGIGVVDTQAKGNSTNSQKASGLASTSKSDAEAGNTDMQHLLGAMERIADSSNKISQIIKTIESIAFQTNLLALNASVEAARAGEHGKGFAVVADEVRSLAGRSSDAAKQTAELIQESMQNVQDGIKAASDTAASLDKIVKNVINVSDVIREISESSEKQTGTIGNINDDLLQVNQIVQGSAATSEETAAAAEELDGQVKILKEKLSFFSTGVSALAVNKVWDVTTADKINATTLRNLPGEHKKYATGEKIVSEGDTNTDTMYFVLEGNVKVVKSPGTLNEKTLSTLKTGDLFGEMALFLKEPRTASVIASNNATVLEIHRDTLSQVMERSPETAYVIIETLCARLRNVLANLETY